MATGEGNLNGRITWNHSQSVIGEPELGDHLGPQHARDVRSSRDAASWRNLLRHAAAADNVPPLEDQRRKPSPRQVGRCRKTVVSSANHYGVIQSAGG